MGARPDLRQGKQILLGCFGRAGVVDKDDVVEEELTTYFKSVILFGKARILNTDKEIFHAAKVFGLKYNNDVTAVEKEIKREWNALSCIEIKIEHMTGKEAIELTRKRG